MVYLLVFICILAIIYFFLNKEKRVFIKYLESKTPNIFLNDRRNYKGIILGVSKKNCHYDDSLNMSNFYRNLYTDFLIIKRYHSFLDEHGSFILDLRDLPKNYFIETEISALDYWLLHEVTLFEHKIKKKGLKYKFILIKATVLFLFRKSSNYSENYEDNLNLELFFEINNFLCERNLILSIVVTENRVEELEKIFFEYKSIRIFTENLKGCN